MIRKILNRYDNSVLWEGEAATVKDAIVAAVKSRADLSRADLYGADLSRANLSRADLYGYYCFGPGGSRNSYTWAKWEELGYMIHCGCQTIKLEDFKKIVVEKHEKSYFAKWYLAHIPIMEMIAEESREAFEQAKEAKRGK